MAIEITNEEINEALESIENNVEEEDRELLKYLALSIGFDILVFATRINRQVALYGATGISNAEVSRILATDLQANGRIFGELRNSIIRGLVLGNNQFSRLGQLNVYGNSIENYRWTTVQGHKICDACIERSGEVDTFANWEARGLPGTGWSVCRGACYCVLVPEDVESSNTLRIDQNQLA